jgi:uncharacterized protein with PIN domain
MTENIAPGLVTTLCNIFGSETLRRFARLLRLGSMECTIQVEVDLGHCWILVDQEPQFLSSVDSGVALLKMQNQDIQEQLTTFLAHSGTSRKELFS